MNLRCSGPDLSGVITPKAILVTCGQSRAASTAGIALGMTVECLPLNFAPFRRPFSSPTSQYYCLALLFGPPAIIALRMPLMDIQAIRDILAHRYPMLLVDRIEELETDRIVGIKNVTVNEPFFVGHFPDFP